MWHSFRVSWDATDYSATADPRPDGLWMRLRRSSAAEGFDEVTPDVHVRVVPASDCDAIAFVTTVCEWRGAPFQVHEERGDDLLLEYIGGLVPVARLLGLERIERGVYRRWVPRAQVQNLAEALIDLSQ